TTVERCNPTVTFALSAKSAAGCHHHIDLLQHAVEHLPTCQASECRDPNVRCVCAAMNFKTDVAASLSQNFGVAHVMIDQRPALIPPFGRIQRLRRALHRITDAVCFCTPAAVP